MSHSTETQFSPESTQASPNLSKLLCAFIISQEVKLQPGYLPQIGTLNLNASLGARDYLRVTSAFRTSLKTVQKKPKVVPAAPPFGS